MIEDARRLRAGQTLRAPVCIVGGGAAGITLALRCDELAIPVLLLEAGGLAAEPTSQNFYKGDLVGPDSHPPAHRFRQRSWGGTTTLWGGRCVPLDPIDMQARDWMHGSGWPIHHSTLAAYYPAANTLCEAGQFAYDAPAAFKDSLPPLLTGLSCTHFNPNRLERFSCPTDFGRRYHKRLAASSHVRVLLHANVTHLQCAADASRILFLTASTRPGHQFTVEAQNFVLAAGGLEVARLLLAASDVRSAGLGNQHDQVGRHYMCHIAGTLGTLRLAPGVTAQDGYAIAPDGVFCRRRLALRARAQRAHRIGNFIARLHHPAIPNPVHHSGPLSALMFLKPAFGYEYGSRLRGKITARDWLRHAANIAAEPVETARFLTHLARGRLFSTRCLPSIIVRPKNGLLTLEFCAEQAPNPTSRVTLGPTLDPLGLPRLRIDWRTSPADLRTVSVAMRLLAADIEASGVGTLTFSEAEVSQSIAREGAYGGHHIGTARMSANPRHGVVDADCRVHGLTNLFVAGSAVFPTSGQANPTLTIVALALRMADHLATHLGAPQILAGGLRVHGTGDVPTFHEVAAASGHRLPLAERFRPPGDGAQIQRVGQIDSGLK